MKIVLDLKNKPKKDDIVIFDGENFECKNYKILFKDLKNEVNVLKDRMEALEDTIRILNKEIRILKGED